MIIETTDQDFQAQIDGAKTPVLVDVWAPWCAPCKSMRPALEAVAKERSATLTTLAVNADENPETVNRFGVRGLPTLLLIKDGEVVNQRAGGAGQPTINAWIDASL